MDSTLYLILATLLFLAIHIVPSTPIRTLALKALGERGYLGLFSLASLGGLAWMSMAYGRAPFEGLWPGLRLVPLAVMPIALILLACGVLTSNPVLLGQAAMLKREDPARGIVRITRHPIMWGIMLWAAAHILAIGSLQAVIFFGGLLLLAAAGTTMQDARKAAQLGEDWQRFAARTSNVPFLAVAQGRNRLVWREIGWVQPAVGLVAFAVVIAFHAWLFGVRPY
ncbi:MAG: NnrU family protein [Betaproteobacteria bacterium]|nr:NnrU family protein [Betaproteobacteria bacterium]